MVIIAEGPRVTVNRDVIMSMGAREEKIAKSTNDYF